jgi:phosphate transport system permease protein
LKSPIANDPFRSRLALALSRGASRGFWRRGEPLVWATAAALAAMLSLVAVLLAVVIFNGLGVFWPASLSQITLADGRQLLGQIVRREVNPDRGTPSIQLKTANREQDPQRQDFRWIDARAIRRIAQPADACILERVENGDFYGYVKGLAGPDIAAAPAVPVGEAFSTALDRIRRKAAVEIAPLAAELFALSNELQSTHDKLLRLKYRARSSSLPLSRRRPAVGPQLSPRSVPGEGTELDRRIAELEAASRQIRERSDRLVTRQQARLAAVRRNCVILANAAGKETPIALADVVRYYQPNAMGFFAKCAYYAGKVGALLWENPRDSNTEGGLFPAIFGTVMLIFLMAISCFPLGVLAGIYLGEYAKDGLLVRLVRIAVNNLAGIPSIVYGIFGLGFFVYGIGGLLDQWFFPERVAAGTPTFGTGGILWASLTLGLLTVPVVIVATEEALRAIPRATREGSFALGATKFQTLVRVLIPMASPGMMTGFILAMARAAGEVAPLMITGVVKLAPQMPVDGVFPFFHLERKFMHLGFHIYDIGFQSPNVEASKPMVYVTTLLLLAIVLAMTSVAIYLRNRMRKLYHVRTL